MKYSTRIKFFLFILLSVNGFATYAQKKVSINENWAFTKEPVAGKWEKINLPHTWNVTDVIDETPGYYRGIGWYKKTMKVSFNKNQKVFIKFLGANNNAELFINGKTVGKHIGGYTAFDYDITPFLNANGQNEILVKVDNTVNFDDLPVSADFTFYGGIYRDVFLIVKDEIHFDMLNNGSAGIFISTPSVSALKGSVKISGVLINKADQKKQVDLTAVVKQADGKVVYENKISKSIVKNGRWNFNLSNIEILNPKLWSPLTPNLYTVEVTIKDKKSQKVIDSSVQPLGFRWFKFDANKGFFLNGEPLKLIGTNRHQDREGYGNALTAEMHEEDIRLIKEMGANFIRLAHYPQDPYVLELCDKYGLLVWEEIPVVNEINTTVEFANNAKLSLTEMIRQHYNHPSIIIWGYMNEIFATNKMRKLVERKELLDKTTLLAKNLEKIAKAEDSSRSTAMALEYTYADEYLETGIGNICDVVGWNLYIGWYQEDMTQFGPFLDKWHKKFPTKSFFISEFGAGSDTRIHSLNPTRYDYSVEYQELNLESYYQQIMARPFVSGATVWNSFDFNSEGRMDVVPNINNKGLLTVDRKPKDSYYFLQAALSKSPILKIATADWKNRTGRAGSETQNFCKQPVVIYSNLPEVELFNNGVSLGKKQVVASKVIWEVPFSDGKNTLVAKGDNFSDQIDVDFKLQPYFLNSPTFKSIAVNFGSEEYFIEQPTGLVWEPERAYTKGYWGYTTTTARNYKQPNRFDVKLTTSDPLYYAYLENAENIQFDVADGAYEVELLFVDQIVGKKFDILVNGQDVFSYPSNSSQRSAITVKTLTSAVNGKGIKVSFDKQQGSSIISGIKIRKRF